MINNNGIIPQPILDGIGGIIGLYILYILADSFCSTDKGFCIYGWKIFGVVFVGIYFWLKYAKN